MASIIHLNFSSAVRMVGKSVRNFSLVFRTAAVILRTAAVIHLNGCCHPFEWLASSIQNFSCAVQTAGIIHSQFFQWRSNIHNIRLKFSRGHSNGICNCFEWLEHLFLIRSLSVHQPFVLTVKWISVSDVFA